MMSLTHWGSQLLNSGYLFLLLGQTSGTHLFETVRYTALITRSLSGELPLLILRASKKRILLWESYMDKDCSIERCRQRLRKSLAQNYAMGRLFAAPLVFVDFMLLIICYIIVQ